MSEWVNTKERSPEYSGDYIVVTNTGRVTQLSYSTRHNSFNADDSLDENTAKMFSIKVSYWQPLPEPPREFYRKD